MPGLDSGEKPARMAPIQRRWSDCESRNPKGIRIAARRRDPARPCPGHGGGHRGRGSRSRPVLRGRGLQRRAQLPAGAARSARVRRDRPRTRDRTGRDAPRRWRLGILRPDGAIARRRAHPRHRVAGLERPRRGRPALGEALPPRPLRRANAGPDRECHPDRPARRGGGGTLVRARYAARAIRRTPRGRPRGR